MNALLEIDDLTVSYPTPTGVVTAVEGVNLSLAPGEGVGLVGASGAGKSSVARAVVGLAPVVRGCVRLDGADLGTASRTERRRLRRLVHLVFQDPYASLPPTLRVADVVAEPLVIHGGRWPRRAFFPGAAVTEALEAVALTPVERFVSRYPHQLSGGERQRVAFARALVTEPRVILADEPTAMLDAYLRAELVDLLDRLRDLRGVAVLHITHDLALAQRSCSRLVVLHEGRVVEEGPTGRVLEAPHHAHTAALVAAAAALRR
ncbi:MAG: dipeptide/oligopeptide/nickel ABC transporter ATP-binding protein [Acidimicrobiia bacterium]